MNKGLNQKYLAEKLAISQSAYAKIESGQTEITMTRLEDLARVFNMNVFDILTYGGVSNLSKYVDSKGGVKISEIDEKKATGGGNNYIQNLYEHIRSRDNELISELREKVSIYKQLYETLLQKIEEKEETIS